MEGVPAEESIPAGCTHTADAVASHGFFTHILVNAEDPAVQESRQWLARS